MLQCCTALKDRPVIDHLHPQGSAQDPIPSDRFLNELYRAGTLMHDSAGGAHAPPISVRMNAHDDFRLIPTKNRCEIHTDAANQAIAP